ncbi:MAG: FHA domain-containing protein [Anaerolineae bacterium]
MADNSRLVMSQGPQPGQTFMLEHDLLTLGRDPANSIVIDDPQVSRQHARIMRQGSLMVIEDLGSTNGTFVNGVRLTGPHTLANGDMIGLGDAVRLTYYGAGVAEGAGIAETETLVGQPAAPSSPGYAAPPAIPQPPPPPAYAPPPPAYVAAPPPVEERKSKTWLWVGCGCLALLTLACIALTVFLWYAPPSFWQALIDLGIPVPAQPF